MTSTTTMSSAATQQRQHDDDHGSDNDQARKDSDVRKAIVEQMNQLDQAVVAFNPLYGKCCYNLATCHGTSKALLILFPKDGCRRQLQTDGTTSPLPCQALIRKARKFLKQRVQHKRQEGDTELPSVETLMEPNLFAVDMSVPSRLRIRGKELLTPCIFPKTVFLSAHIICGVEKRKEDSTSSSSAAASAAAGEITKGGRTINVSTQEIPMIAAMLLLHCVLPGGPWSVYNLVCRDESDNDNKDEDNPKDELHKTTTPSRNDDDDGNHKKLSFTDVQAQFLQKEQSSAPPPSTRTKNSLATALEKQKSVTVVQKGNCITKERSKASAAGGGGRRM